MAGEISRAHGGMLLLDEFLEFHPRVQEALREPFEEGLIRVARAGIVEEFPAQALIVATTNLCPCGDFVPQARQALPCRYSKVRCQSYSQKLSGPLLDRFQMLVFTSELEKPITTMSEIFEAVEKARIFQAELGNRQKISRWPGPELERGMDTFELQFLQKIPGSERRRLSTLRVARSFAMLEGSELVRSRHIQEAMIWTSDNFEKMKRWDL